jgi:hypothetical protein
MDRMTNFLAADIFVNGVDPVAVGILGGQAEQPSPRCSGATSFSIIIHGEVNTSVSVLGSAYAPQAEDVAGGVLIRLWSSNCLRRPAGVDRLGEDTTNISVAVLPLDPERTWAVVPEKLSCTFVYDWPWAQELLAVQAAAEGLALGEGEGRRGNEVAVVATVRRRVMIHCHPRPVQCHNVVAYGEENLCDLGLTERLLYGCRSQDWPVCKTCSCLRRW